MISSAKVIYILVVFLSLTLSAGILDHTLDLSLLYQSDRLNHNLFQQDLPQKEQNLLGPEVINQLALFIPDYNFTVNHNLYIYTASEYSSFNQQLSVTTFPLFTTHYTLPLTLSVEHGSPEKLAVNHFLFTTLKAALLKQHSKNLLLWTELIWNHHFINEVAIEHLQGDQFGIIAGCEYQSRGFIQKISVDLQGYFFNFAAQNYHPEDLNDIIELDHIGDRYQINSTITLSYQKYRLNINAGYQIIRWYEPATIQYFDPLLEQYTLTHIFYRRDHHLSGKITLSRNINSQFTLLLSSTVLKRWSNFNYHLKDLFSQLSYTGILSIRYENSYF